MLAAVVLVGGVPHAAVGPQGAQDPAHVPAVDGLPHVPLPPAEHSPVPDLVPARAIHGPERLVPVQQPRPELQGREVPAQQDHAPAPGERPSEVLQPLHAPQCLQALVGAPPGERDLEEGDSDGFEARPGELRPPFGRQLRETEGQVALRDPAAPAEHPVQQATDAPTPRELPGVREPDAESQAREAEPAPPAAWGEPADLEGAVGHVAGALRHAADALGPSCRGGSPGPGPPAARRPAHAPGARPGGMLSSSITRASCSSQGLSATWNVAASLPQSSTE